MYWLSCWPMWSSAYLLYINLSTAYISYIGEDKFPELHFSSLALLVSLMLCFDAGPRLHFSQLVAWFAHRQTALIMVCYRYLYSLEDADLKFQIWTAHHELSGSIIPM